MISTRINRKPAKRFGEKVPLSAASGRAGFTLFEILISLSIFAVVLVTLFGSYSAVFSKADAIASGADLYEMIKNGMNQISADLRFAYVVSPPLWQKPDGMEDTPHEFRIVGDTFSAGGDVFSRLRFASANHIALEGDSRQGIAEIIYYVYSPDGERTYLKRADRLPPYGEFEPRGVDPTLLTDVASFSILFYDEEMEPFETWDSESEEFDYATPRAVRIQVELGPESGSLYGETLVPLHVYREKIE